MLARTLGVVPVLLVAALGATGRSAAPENKVEGSFRVGGTDAGLRYARAVPAVLDDKGNTGYALLVSARPAQGDISSWRTGEPAKQGSFIYIIFEKTGAVWIAELGHSAAKRGRFGVVTEVKATKFEVRDNRLIAHFGTEREQSFFEDRYTIDLKVDAAIEK